MIKSQENGYRRNDKTLSFDKYIIIIINGENQVFFANISNKTVNFHYEYSQKEKKIRDVN